mmetsp:Transcript_47/g.106  ORF Transcript_47/g.106 Transcript_47/m.106 type:complete len:268 (-) Transcript_47:726-1529(-)
MNCTTIMGPILSTTLAAARCISPMERMFSSARRPAAIRSLMLALTAAAAPSEQYESMVSMSPRRNALTTAGAMSSCISSRKPSMVNSGSMRRNSRIASPISVSANIESYTEYIRYTRGFWLVSRASRASEAASRALRATSESAIPNTFLMIGASIKRSLNCSHALFSSSTCTTAVVLACCEMRSISLRSSRTRLLTSLNLAMSWSAMAASRSSSSLEISADFSAIWISYREGLTSCCASAQSWASCSGLLTILPEAGFSHTVSPALL